MTMTELRAYATELKVFAVEGPYDASSEKKEGYWSGYIAGVNMLYLMISWANSKDRCNHIKKMYKKVNAFATRGLEGDPYNKRYWLGVIDGQKALYEKADRK